MNKLIEKMDLAQKDAMFNIVTEQKITRRATLQLAKAREFKNQRKDFERDLGIDEEDEGLSDVEDSETSSLKESYSSQSKDSELLINPHIQEK